jgi:hypothetical protein
MRGPGVRASAVRAGGQWQSKGMASKILIFNDATGRLACSSLAQIYAILTAVSEGKAVAMSAFLS